MIIEGQGECSVVLKENCLVNECRASRRGLLSCQSSSSDQAKSSPERAATVKVSDDEAGN